MGARIQIETTDLTNELSPPSGEVLLAVSSTDNKLYYKYPNGSITDVGLRGVTGSQGPGLTGPQGYQGPIGPQGYQGFQGFGPTGPQGSTGSQGFQGVTGSGTQGVTGSGVYTSTQSNPVDFPLANVGESIISSLGYVYQWDGGTWNYQYSIIGPQGVTGIQGPTGVQGGQGPQGLGPTGSQGVTGSQGPTGPQGNKFSSTTQSNPLFFPPSSLGDTMVSSLGYVYQWTGAFWTYEYSILGPQGYQGPQGVTGVQGASGGPQGFQGATGPQGFQGATGAQGFQGYLGPTGSQGSGATGATGATGMDGSATQSWAKTLSVDNNSQTFSAVMGTATTISSANGGAFIALDYYSTPTALWLDANSTTNDVYIELYENGILLNTNTNDLATSSFVQMGPNQIDIVTPEYRFWPTIQGFGGDGIIQKGYKITTTDNTPLNIATISGCDGTFVSIQVKAIVSGRYGYTNSYAGDLWGVFKYDGVGTVQVGTTNSNHFSEFLTASSIIKTDGTNIFIEVAGENGKNIDWSVFYEEYIITS